MSTADELRELEMGAKEALSVDRTWPSVAAALIQAQALHRLADALAPLERIAGAMEANRARGEEPLPADIRQAEARQFAEEQREVLTQATAPDPLPIRIGKGWIHGVTPEATGLARSYELVKVYDPSISKGWGLMQASEVTDLDLWAPEDVHASPLFRELSRRRQPTTPDQTESTPSAPQEPPQAASATPGGHPLDQEGWIRSRVPTEGDGDEDGEVRVLRRDGKGSHWCHYSTVVLGQPWVRFNVRDPSSAPTLLPAHLAYPTSEGWVHDRVPWPDDADEDGDVVIPPTSTDLIPWSHVVPGQPWRSLRTRTP